jgi:hypothetical protein
MPQIHSVLSNKCTVRDSKLDNLGVFASAKIDKDEVIAIWGGRIYSEKEMSALAIQYPNMLLNPFGVYWGYYMGPLKPEDPVDDAERFNHSCNPNAGIKGQIILVARRPIEANEEICFDYETAETTETGLMFNCKCNTSTCRKSIDGTAWKNHEFISKNREYLSWYLLEKIKFSA